MKLVPLGGAWNTIGQAAGLHASAKNPMSLALDHDKLVVSCPVIDLTNFSTDAPMEASWSPTLSA